MKFRLAMIAKDISEIANWLHRINSNKPQTLDRKDIEIMEDKAVKVQEFIVSLYQYLNEAGE